MVEEEGALLEGQKKEGGALAVRRNNILPGFMHHMFEEPDTFLLLVLFQFGDILS